MTRPLSVCGCRTVIETENVVGCGTAMKPEKRMTTSLKARMTTTLAKGPEAQVNTKAALYDTTIRRIKLVVIKASPITIGSTLQKDGLNAGVQRIK